MSTGQINEKLAFLHQYVMDLEKRDEKTVQLLTAFNKPKEWIMNYLFNLINEYEALLGQNLRKKRAKRFRSTLISSLTSL